MKELFRKVAVDESMTYRIWLAAVGTVRVTYSILQRGEVLFWRQVSYERV